MLEKYVLQLPGLGRADLKKRFSDAGTSDQVAILNDIGILAVRDKCRDSISFLIENLNHEQPDVRRVAIDYLSDLSSQHPLIFSARKALKESIDKMNHEKGISGGMCNFAKRSFNKMRENR